MRRTTFAILCLEGATLSFNVAAASALIPSISREFVVPQFITGKIIWLYMIPYGIAALFYGPLVRTFNAKKVELVCFFLFCLANLMAAFAGNINTLFAARFLMGVFGASVIPLVLILIGKYSKTDNRGKLIGIFFSSTFIASLLGLFLSGYIYWRWIFMIPAIFGLILWIHMYFYLDHFRTSEDDLKISYLLAFKNRQVISAFTYIFFISLFYHGIQQWLAVYFSKAFNFSQLLISMLVTLTSFSGIIGELVGGIFSDVLGRVKTINLGIILMILSVVCLIFKLPVIILAIIMIIWGLGWTLNHAGVSTLLTDMPAEFLNESASLNSSVRFIAGGLGTVLGGLLMQRSFVLSFSVFGIGLVLLVIFAKRLLIVK